MIARAVFGLFGALALAGCGATTPPPAPLVAPPVPQSAHATGLDRVMGSTAAGLVAQFGIALQDVREEGARKLQFGNGICILDAYLYPPSKGKEPVVTYLSARQPDGKDADKANCVTALQRRR
jgi:hypothetical protein